LPLVVFQGNLIKTNQYQLINNSVTAHEKAGFRAGTGFFVGCRAGGPTFGPSPCYPYLVKKTLLLLIAATGLSASAAQAQYRGRGGNVSLGLKAGATLTNLAGADAPSLNNRFGFQVGGFANIGLSKLFAFQPELLFSQKGYWSPVVGDYGTRLNYLDVPLAFHVNTDGFFFEAGPQVGFLLTASSQAGSVSQDVKSQYNTLDLGYLFGLGYQLKHGLGAGLRYNGGASNIYVSTTNGNTTTQSRQRNSAFQLYATYSFN